MTSLMLVKLRMIQRVRDLLVANPLGYPEGDEVVAQLVKRVERVDALLTQKETGEQASRTSTAYRQELRRAISRVTLRHVLKVAKLLAPTHPDVAAGIRRPPPGKSEESFLARVKAITQEVDAHKDLFLGTGLSAEGFDELKQQVSAYEQSMANARAARRDHTGAQTETRAQLRQLMQVVQMLDGMVGLRFRDKPDLLGAWRSARNVAWPVAEPKSTGETTEVKPAA